MRPFFLKGLLLLILVGIGAFALVSLNTPLEPVILPDGAAADPGRISEETEYYDIAATYPTETPLQAAAGERANQIAVELMKGFVATTIAQFKTDGDFTNLSTEDAAFLGYDDGRKQTLSIGHVSAISSTTLSYVFTVNTYTLGAHGNTYYKTFTFDAASGRSLKLGDLFTPQAPYLARLTTLTRASLSDQLELPSDDQMIATGTAPADTSFEHFFLDENSLVILFPPYAVAAYAAGPQTVAIPRSELTDILKPEYQ